MDTHPMNLLPRLAALLLVAACGLARAAGGHDHGPAAAPAAASLPRFAAVSEQLELVGVLDGRTLTLWLDRFEDNRPVPGARIELALGDAKPAVTAQADGVYAATLDAAPAAGMTAVTATVTVDGASDLIAGELDIHADTAHADSHAHSLREWALWGGGAALVALALYALARRSRAARGDTLQGGAA